MAMVMGMALVFERSSAHVLSPKSICRHFIGWHMSRRGFMLPHLDPAITIIFHLLASPNPTFPTPTKSHPNPDCLSKRQDEGAQNRLDRDGDGDTDYRWRWRWRW